MTLPCVTITEPLVDNRYANGRGYLTQQESIEVPYIRHQESIDEDIPYKHHDFPERIDEDPYLEQQVTKSVKVWTSHVHIYKHHFTNHKSFRKAERRKFFFFKQKINKQIQFGKKNGLQKNIFNVVVIIRSFRPYTLKLKYTMLLMNWNMC